MSTLLSLNSPSETQHNRLVYPHIELHPKYDSDVIEARIEGRRISVANIAHWYYKEGDSVEYIAQEYDLTWAQVHAALAYYHDHRPEIDQQEAATRAWAEEMAKIKPSAFRERLNN